MKSERRHELQQNELAEQLDKAKTWIEPYVVPILVGVIVITVVGMGYNFWQTRAVGQRSEATLELLFAGAQLGQPGDPEAYERVAERFADLSAAEMAQLSKADILLGRGIDALYRDRAEAEGLLEDAVQAYRRVGESTSSTLLKSRAHFGLAQALESRGELEEAREAYQQVIDLNESPAMVRLAERRLELCGSEEVGSFVSWFEQQQPVASGGVDVPGLPSDSGLPDLPTFELPEPGEREGDGADAATQTPPVTDPVTDTPADPSPPDDDAAADAAEVQLPPADAPPSGDAETDSSPADPPADESPAVVPPPGDGQPAADEPAGEEPPGDEPAGEAPSGDEPPGDEPAGEAPASPPAPQEPAAEEPSGSDEPSGGAAPSGDGDGR